jgi:ubiquinone/menaquinone biosynthesis C-methylase UbiE
VLGVIWAELLTEFSKNGTLKQRNKTMDNKNRMVCPMRVAGLLDSKFRRIFHNPNKILKPYIQKNIPALDTGCGPGVFSIEIAKLLDGTGKVISVDMQDGMLEIIKSKIIGKSFEKNIVLHKCTQDSINVKENVDFVLMFYMVHEVPNKGNLFNEVIPLINKNGLLMIVEPGLVSTKEFNGIINNIREKGFEEYKKLKIPLSKGIALKKL